MKTFYRTIYEWVAHNYGQRKAEDMGWDIAALADHLSRTDIDPDELSAYTKVSVHSALDQHYLEEDVENYAEDHGYKLTDKQVEAVADEIRNSEWYCSIDANMLSEYIKEELKKGETMIK